MPAMTPRAFFKTIFAALFIAIGHCPAAEPTPAEKAKIEALIANVEGLADAKFVRNGTTYDAKTAAKFLRGKWNSNSDDIATAADFIAKAATGSSTSGKPYLIRQKDGSETKCAEYLAAQLKKLEEKAK